MNRRNLLKHPVVAFMLLSMLLLSSVIGCAKKPVAKEPIVIITAWGTDVESLDPHQHGGSTTMYKAQVYCFESLIRWKYGTAELEGGLATSWTLAPDLKSVTFDLRRNVKFTDGTPFNAQAVKYSFDRIKAINAGPATYLRTVASLDVLDDYKVRLNLSTPSSTFIYEVPKFLIISPAHAEKNKTADDPWAKAKLLTNPCGTGPYTLASWDKGHQLVFDRNPNYWGPFKEYSADRHVMLGPVDPQTRKLMLERGEVDIIAQMEQGPALAVELKRNPQWKSLVAPTMTSIMVTIRTDKGPLKDVRVRQALIHAFDSAGFLASTLEGGLVGTEYKYIVSPKMAYFDQSAVQSTYNLERAAALLAQAGYPGGKGLKFTLIIGEDRPIETGIATVLKDGLTKLGVGLEISAAPFAPKAEKMGNPETALDMATLYYIPALPTPLALNQYFGQDFLPPKGNNWSRYSNPRVNELYALSYQTSDPAVLAQYMSEIQKTLANDVPAIFTCALTNITFHTARISGHEFCPFMPGYNTMYMPQNIEKRPQ